VPKLRINLGSDAPALLDIGSYGRRGPARRDHLSAAQIELIGLTIHRAPEVMVKVLNRGGTGLKAVHAHLRYLYRQGTVGVETDDGRQLKGEGVEKALLADWDLDLDEGRHTTVLKPRETSRTPKLVHKLIFSMPPGTPPKKVLAAVKNFAREEFGLKYRYAIVLHTDEPHPHVHMIVKALGKDGQRLNIRKATLREWRGQFARHLRELGVSANATQRVVRGKPWTQKPDGIHRARMRGASTHYQRKSEAAARGLTQPNGLPDAGKEQLVATRNAVVAGWRAVSEDLARQGHLDLASEVSAFAASLPPALTEKELLQREWLESGKRDQMRDVSVAHPDRSAPRDREERSR
jgi:hypothetical protein